ncbi:MAG TPA: tripartite tricarboxylate transporter TctB family protein [Methylibium sp.]|nr:tripartite tricarboxylate transporter TctB family protein [Methylibium sp.]
MNSESSNRAVGTRWPELAVAAFLLALAGLVIADSLRVGIGWADDGPRSGYFPFYIGLMLAGSSGWVLVRSLMAWHQASPVFAEREQLALVLAMLLPMTVYVGAIWLLGIYVASFALIGYFMRRHGKFGWPLCATVGIGVPLAFFFVFERWFLVPLPKGPIEGLLGL